MLLVGFPGSSADKESTCNAGDPGSSPGSGRSPGKGIGCPLQYSWASLVAQLVKNLPAMWETWVRSLGWEDPLEMEMATHSSILAWRIPRTVLSIGSQTWTQLRDFHFQVLWIFVKLFPHMFIDGLIQKMNLSGSFQWVSCVQLKRSPFSSWYEPEEWVCLIKEKSTEKNWAALWFLQW